MFYLFPIVYYTCTIICDMVILKGCAWHVLSRIITY